MKTNRLKDFAKNNRSLFLGDIVAPDVIQFLEDNKADRRTALQYAEMQSKYAHQNKREKMVGRKKSLKTHCTANDETYVTNIVH